jgi:hypothetical protein
MAGNFILERATREEVETFLVQSAASAPELLMGLAARPDVEIPRPYKTTGAVYRLTLKNGAEFPPLEGGSQKVVSLGERGILLRVTSRVPPREKVFRLPLEPMAELGEYLQPSVFVPCDDERIVKVAGGVVRGDSDAWSAAKKLETWVQRNIRTKSLGMGLAPPVEALETGEGDCTEHAMLLAALCRSIGIPSRVAVGLLYFQGSFAGHMWTEVCLGSEWYPLDAVLAEPVVDSARIRFSTSSLSGSGTSDAFQGVSRLLGNLDIEVQEIAHGDRVWRREGGTIHTISGQTLTSTLYGVSFSAPIGCSLEKSEKGLGLVMIPSGSRIAVSALDLTGAETVEASITSIIDGDRVVSRSESVLEGRRRIRLDIERRSLLFLKSHYLEELVLDGDTLLRFSMKVKDEATDPAILGAILGSLSFEGEPR